MMERIRPLLIFSTAVASISTAGCGEQILSPSGDEPGFEFVSPRVFEVADTVVTSEQLDQIGNWLDGMDSTSPECDAAKAFMEGWIADHDIWINTGGNMGQPRFYSEELVGTLATTSYYGNHPHDPSDFSHTTIDPCAFNSSCNYAEYGIGNNQGLIGHEGMHPGLDRHMGPDETFIQGKDNECEVEV